MSNEEKVIQTKITGKDVIIRIPKNFVINDFNEMMAGFKIKGNKKTQFIKEFTEQLIKYIENEDSFMEIYEELISNDEIIKDINDDMPF